MTEEHKALIEKGRTLNTEIIELENHIKAGEQFQGEDMYEMLMGMTEEILRRKQRELDKVISQLEEIETKQLLQKKG